MYTYSEEHKKFLSKIKKEKIIVVSFQIAIALIFLIIWEVLARLGLINTFLSSSPSKVLNTTINLFKTGDLFSHVWVTVWEVLLSFFIATVIGFITAIVLWSNKIISKIVDPYLTILNSLPKVALGPLIIIWVGASTNSIVFMALLISVFITIINIYNGFVSTNKVLNSFNATKTQIFFKAVLPSNIITLINACKINISMSLIGVIMGELLVSKKGLGYLIMYGSQVFNIDLVITSLVILGIISYLLYFIVDSIEKKVINAN